MDKWEWQSIREDEWIFGQKVRGLVRDYRAEVFRSANKEAPEEAWFWIIWTDAGDASSGHAVGFEAAVEAAERCLDPLLLSL